MLGNCVPISLMDYEQLSYPEALHHLAKIDNKNIVKIEKRS